MIGGLREMSYAARALPWKLAAHTGFVRRAVHPVQYVVENANWSIRWDGESICDAIEKRAPGTISVTHRPYLYANSVMHFGSQYMWLAWGPHLHRGNQYVATFYHGKREDGDGVARHIDMFLESVPRLARVVTAATLIEDRLKGWGIPSDKIVRIPIGVDTRLFRPPSAEERATARQAFGIPPDAVVIGSFQKDGVGWGSGMKPKLIKGPDTLLNVISKLKRDFPVHVFLTGPARGYVKKGLERIDVPFTHTYVKTHAELSRCYHALDLYFVTSREEGGPKGIMEAMASSVPVVSTRVGMALDLIKPGVTGGLVEPEEDAAFADQAGRILAMPNNAIALRDRAYEAVQSTDWSHVGKQHYDLVYKPLLAR